MLILNKQTQLSGNSVNNGKHDTHSQTVERPNLIVQKYRKDSFSRNQDYDGKCYSNPKAKETLFEDLHIQQQLDVLEHVPSSVSQVPITTTSAKRSLLQSIICSTSNIKFSKTLSSKQTVEMNEVNCIVVSYHNHLKTVWRFSGNCILVKRYGRHELKKSTN